MIVIVLAVSLFIVLYTKREALKLNSELSYLLSERSKYIQILKHQNRCIRNKCNKLHEENDLLKQELGIHMNDKEIEINDVVKEFTCFSGVLNIYFESGKHLRIKPFNNGPVYSKFSGDLKSGDKINSISFSKLSLSNKLPYCDSDVFIREAIVKVNSENKLWTWERSNVDFTFKVTYE